MAYHAADISYKDFMQIYRKRTSKPYSFLTIDTNDTNDHTNDNTC